MTRFKFVLAAVILIAVQVLVPVEKGYNHVFAAPQTISGDNFDSGTWSGGTGWFDAWSHSGTSSISNTNYASPGYCLRLALGDGIATRTVDLSNWTNVTLTYNFRAYSFEGNDHAYVRIFDGAWHTVQTIANGDDRDVYYPISIDLTPYRMVSNFQIQFASGMNNAYDIVYFDDIVISGTSVVPTPTPTPTLVSTPTPTPTSITGETPTPTPTLTPTPTPTPTPTQSSGLRVLFYNNNRQSTTNSISPWFRVTNETTTAIDLSQIKLRYYYTIDGEISQNFWCDWSTINKNRVIGTFVKMINPTPDADYYLEISFDSRAGSINPGATVEIQTRFAKTDSTNYSQGNDYSYNSTASNYIEWQKVTAYLNGVLVWGIEPAVPTPTITPTPTPTPLTTPTPSIIPTPSLSPSPANGQGLRGEYYNNEDFTGIAEIRIDPTVDFDWGEFGSPSSSMDADTFSVRWIGKVEPKYSEEYTFYTLSDDGVRLWVNNTLIIDNWTVHAAVEDSGIITLMAGQKYDIRMEYYDNTMHATAKLYWASASQLKEVIPQSQLFPPKMFQVQEHRVRTADNSFVIGDYMPLLLRTSVLWPVSNPVIDIDLSVKKTDGSDSGFLMREIKSGTEINKNYIKIFINGAQILTTDYNVWVYENLGNRRLNIRILKSFNAGDQLELRYFVKASAKESVFNQGVDRYLNANGLSGINLKVDFRISEWQDLGLTMNTPYTIYSTDDPNEILAFWADVKLEDPIILD